VGDLIGIYNYILKFVSGLDTIPYTVQRVTSLTDITRRIELEAEDFPEDGGVKPFKRKTGDFKKTATRICVVFNTPLFMYSAIFVKQIFKPQFIFMSVNSKHIATFLLGAAAAFAAHKYMTMTPEEKEKLSADLKDKASQFKGEAESAMDKGKEYFEELKTKGGDALKEHLGDLSGVLHNLFGGAGSTGQTGTETKI